MRRLLVWIAVFSGMMGANATLWENPGPGGGGQIQYVYPVPEIPGRVYFLSDMEGLYRSDNYGTNWNFIGEDLKAGGVYVLESEPGNPERVYVAGHWGIDISDDGGIHWNHVYDPNGPHEMERIASIKIDPSDPARVYAAPGWHEDDSFKHAWTGPRYIYRTDDRGATWHKTVYESADGYQQVFDITVDGNGKVYVGADSGVYVSTDHGKSFTKLAPPTGLAAETCRGLDLSPDGKWLYAVYGDTFGAPEDRNKNVQYTKTTKIYVTPTDVVAWQCVSDGLLASDYWRPRVSPNSTAKKHRLLAGPLTNGNIGLYSVDFVIDESGKFSGHWKMVLENRPGETPRLKEPGWNNIQVKCRHYIFNPSEWNAGANEEVWASVSQHFFLGSPDFPNDWKIKSSVHAGDLEGYPEYSTGKVRTFVHNGFNPTFSYDHYGYKNYVVQGQGDNGMLESWDGGKTWSQRIENMEEYMSAVVPGNRWWFDNADQFLFVPLEPAPVLLSGIGFLFGGGPHDAGMLFALPLKTLSPRDHWRHIAGVSFKEADRYFNGAYQWNFDNPGAIEHGLPPGRYTAMAYNPQNPKEVLIGANCGLFMIDDVQKLIEKKQGDFYLVDPMFDKYSFRRVEYDPQNENVVYVMGRPYNNAGYGKTTGTGGVWRGERGSRGWKFKQIFKTGGAGNTANYDMAVWQAFGKTHVMVSSADRGPEPTVYLSSNGGKNWKIILTRTEAITVPLEGETERSEPTKTWYNPDEYNLVFSSVAGEGNALIATLGQHGKQRGYGIFKGTLSPDGTVDWVNWTGIYEYGKPFMFFPNCRRARFIETNGKKYVYFSSMGTGVWRRELK